MSRVNDNLSDRLWKFFSSVRLALVLLLLLAATSIIGTVLQQNRATQEYVREYGEIAYRLFAFLSLTDMYHSWWFLLLLLLFCVNLVVCSLNRLPHILKLVREPQLHPEPSFFRGLPLQGEFQVAGSTEQAASRISALVNDCFAPVVRRDVGNNVYLFAQKQAWSRFGVYITHVSIVVIVLGAIVGNLFGYKGYINIVEGGVVDEVWVRGGKEPVKFGFAVRCDSFDVSFYPGGRPKEYRSTLSVVENGNLVVDRRSVVVNDPLRYRGITFYQSSYGPAGPPSFLLNVTPRGGAPVEIGISPGETRPLPAGGTLRLVDYLPDFQGMGPAVKVEVSLPGKENRSRIILQNHPGFDAKRGSEYAVDLVEYDEQFYTGLQVAKDPGVWIVWLGCLMMVVGSLVAFFASHRRLWFRLEPAGDSVSVRMGGAAHRNSAAFETVFCRIRSGLPSGD